jgi:hypothetical protein
MTHQTISNAAIQAKNEKTLSTKLNYSGIGILTRKEFLHLTKEQGARVEISQKPLVEYNRIKYNRMTGREQDEYERKCNTMVLQYCLYKGEGGYFEITKTEYDYFLSI